ncbi:crossover junction endodeoxyribonuclease RuvC [candidate division WWE3 bacterium]|nr:crossover junction endodeoxyribonuclease RuvC [candidate division WWE3 bacterium]
MSRRKKILGIDPGLADLGWGIIEVEKNRVFPVDYGVIKTKANTPLAERLSIIYTELKQLISQHQPDHVGIEKLFFGKNAKTAMSVGEARGVVVLTLFQHALIYTEFTPAAVKIALTGYGNADKHQVQEMVKHTLKLRQIPKPDDAADALAIAITMAYNLKLNQIVEDKRKDKEAAQRFYQKIQLAQQS